MHYVGENIIQILILKNLKHIGAFTVKNRIILEIEQIKIINKNLFLGMTCIYS